MTQLLPAPMFSHSYCDNVTNRDKSSKSVKTDTDTSVWFDRSAKFDSDTPVRFDRSVRSDRISRRNLWPDPMPWYPEPWSDTSVKSDRIPRRPVLLTYALCPDLSRLTFFGQSWQSAQCSLIRQHCSTGGKEFIPPFPPSIQFSLGFLLKKPLFFYNLKRPGSQGEGSVWGWLSLAPAH